MPIRRIKRITNMRMVSFLAIVLEQFNLDKNKIVKKTTYISFELNIQRIKKIELQTLIHLPKIRGEVLNDKVLFFSIGKPTFFFDIR